MTSMLRDKSGRKFLNCNQLKDNPLFWEDTSERPKPAAKKATKEKPSQPKKTDNEPDLKDWES